MDAKDIITLIALCVTAIGALVAVAGFAFNRVSREALDASNRELRAELKQLEALITKKDRDSVEAHSGFITRNELKAELKEIRTELTGGISNLSQLYQGLLEGVTGLASRLTGYIDEQNRKRT